MADLVDEIKSRVDIVTVVSQYVQLKKAGQNYKGVCPFHSEKSPSFVVSPEKQICHCFGCNKGGDVISFIEEIEGVDFVEAIQLLADRAGIKVENVAKFNKGQKNEKDEYFKSHELACEFFEKQLFTTNDGQKVLDYLYKRGVTDETIRKFRLGFAPDAYDALYPLLIKKGISRKVLVKSGLATSKNLADENIYDKYRARLIFPIFDYLGRVCGFGGRALKKEQSPKYLNSPENPIYNKSKILYGLYHAKQEIKRKDQAVLVEGYFDVILPFQAGVENVVATSGTALTEDQVKILKRITSSVVTCFDTDEAGFEATKRSFSLLRNGKIMVKTVAGVSQKDPADVVKEEGGEAFAQLIDKAQDFVSFYMAKLVEGHDLSSISGRKNVLKELLPFYKEMTPTDLDFYVKSLAAKLGVKEEFLYDEIASFKLPAGHPARQESSSKGSSLVGEGAKMSLQQLVLGLLIFQPELFALVGENLSEESFDEEFKAIYKGLSDQYNSTRKSAGVDNLREAFAPELRAKIDLMSLYVEDLYGQFSSQILEEELEKLVDKLNKDVLDKKLEHLRLEIVQAEEAQDGKKLVELLDRLKQLIYGKNK